MASELQPTRNSSNSGSSSPELPSQSRGSSVSTSLREEYEDLLRYAVVTPALNGRTPRQRSSATPSQRQTPGVVATRGKDIVRTVRRSIDIFETQLSLLTWVRRTVMVRVILTSQLPQIVQPRLRSHVIHLSQLSMC